ncbi:hypothetical protein N7499_012209 [Penicillium canescens]|uniref:Piwi domain-containing protein n=2 Tax=Penicillium canescens TaxID=5083 RepID=A0AAD6N4E0_PENCN|nr:hypothetical protein N7460_010067 [Penicillium canescens]KAJ6060174.1 hypothetical protein N7444_002028 [Penicillium canescens]KAJ6063529.1 hypothetical protein N7499_012209 [Penicillium canescens]
MRFRPERRGNSNRGGFRGDFRGRGGDRGGAFLGRGDFRCGRRCDRGDINNYGPPIFRQGGTIPVPSHDVTKTENDLAKDLAMGGQKAPRQAKYPERPGYGTAGRPVTLYANYLPLSLPNKQLFRYHISIAADSAGRSAPVGKKARQIVRLLLEEHFPHEKKSIASDFRSTLVSYVKLTEGNFDVRYKEDLENDYPETPRVHSVTIQYTGDINPADLMNYLRSTNAGAMLEYKEEIVAALNVIIGHHPKTDDGVVSVGANRHYSIRQDTMESFNLGGGLSVLRGYFVSARAATARVLLNMQIKYIACYSEGPLANMIQGYGNRNTYYLEKFLKNLRVRITHIARKNSRGQPRPRIKPIYGLANRGDGASSANPPKVTRHGAGPNDVEFFINESSPQRVSVPGAPEPKDKKGKKAPRLGPAEAGRYTTVAAFFKREYNMSLDPNLPVVNVGSHDRPIYLPCEVCVVEPGQPAKSKLSGDQIASMRKFAVTGRKPGQNAQSIVSNGLGVLGLGQPLNATLSAFGINSSTDLITLPGRVLPAPKVYYKDGNRTKEIRTNAGSWNMCHIQFSKPSVMKSWTYLYIDQQGSRPIFHNPDQLNASLQGFRKTLRDMGMSVNPHKVGKRVILTGKNDAADINAAVLELRKQHNPDLILGIFCTKDTTIYNCVKQVCDVRCGIRNVNVLAEKLVNPNDQYNANVGLKINLKLGGANQALRTADLGIISEGKTMLVGIDVTHPSPGSASSAPSVAGIVASVDSTLAQWPAEIRVQVARQEMVADLEILLVSRLLHWRNLNKNLPENIIVYRDGVSEGQYNKVIDQELPLLQAACRKTYPADQSKKGLPRLAIIVVGKRHNTRFYPTTEQDSNRDNPIPGTVVDRGVSEARHWDFFLQAHSTLQGTARPAHYFTIWDEIFYPRHPAISGGLGAADALQGLTHKICYMFGRATKAVSVCPPAYYADLVCTRARCFLFDLFDPVSIDSNGNTNGTDSTVNMSRTADVVIHPKIAETMFYI